MGVGVKDFVGVTVGVLVGVFVGVGVGVLVTGVGVLVGVTVGVGVGSTQQLNVFENVELQGLPPQLYSKLFCQ